MQLVGVEIDGKDAGAIGRSNKAVPLELVDEFSTRIGADLSLNLADGQDLFAFKTELLNATDIY